MSSQRYTILLSENDLEAKAIAKLGRERGHRVIDWGMDWGGRLDPLDSRLQDLDPGVILVEIPHPAFEAFLRNSGKVVHVVDHHISLAADGSLIDRRHPRSSLEQVSALLGAGPLDKEQRQVSANDCGYIPALTAMNLDEEKIRALRNEELNIRLSHNTNAKSLEETKTWLKDNPDRIQVLDTKRPGKSKDPCLILVHAPTDYSACLLDAVYDWWQQKSKQKFGETRLEVLALYEGGGEDKKDDGTETPSNKLQEFEFSGSADRVALLEELAAESRNNAAARLALWAGGGGGGCFFSARDDLGTEDRAVSDLADSLLNELLTGNRPLVSWRSHFLQVLTTSKPFVPKSECFKAEKAENADRHYFLNHLRDLLIPASGDGGGDGGGAKSKSQDCLRSYRWNNPCCWDSPGLTFKITIPASSDKGDSKALHLEVPIKALRLHQFLDCVVVEWECAGGMEGHDQFKGIKFPDDKKPLWRHLLDPESRKISEGGLSTMAQLLDFNWAARQCFSPYENAGDSARVILSDGQGKRGELAFGIKRSDDEIDGWFASLLSLAGLKDQDPEKDLGPKLVFDERARVVSGVVALGKAPTTKAGQAKQRVTLARLRGVDPYEPTHFYATDFAEEELKKGWYGRFTNHDTYYMASEHSFTMLAHGWFAANHILPAHLPRPYKRLFLIALLYEATLHVFSRKMADLARGDGHPSDKEVRKLRQKFTTFANGLWFDTVSSQIQGDELFKLIREQMPIKEAYDALKNDIERTDELQDAIQTRAFSIIGAGGLILAITTSFLGMNVFDKETFDCFGGPLMGGLAMGAGVALVGVILVFLAWKRITGSKLALVGSVRSVWHCITSRKEDAR